MSEPSVRWERRGDVAFVTIDNPPLNALAPATSGQLVAAVERSQADAAVVATVIVGAGGTFVAGADIRQLGKAGEKPAVPAPRASERIDLSPKPVVAAVDGFAIGGGLEIALACHGRVATERAEFGLGETLIGVIPGGGGTQRLPRVVGIGKALEIVQSGRRFGAAEALALDVVDLVEDDPARLEAVAADFARRLAALGSLPCIRDSAIPDAPEARPALFAAARRRADATKLGNRKALHAAVDAVEAAATLSFEEGMRREQELFASLVGTDEARALRYAFFAEREARKVPGMPKVADAAPRRAAVIGAGTMGTGIAMAFADNGIAVKLLDRDVAAVARGMERIASTYEASVKRGSLGPAERDARLARILRVDRYEALSDCDVIVEAVFEDLALKRDIFGRLDAAAPRGALLLSNTSTIDIGLIAQGHARAENIAGAHFFSPANVMKLVEVVDGPQTAPATLARTFALARRIGKIPAVAGSCDGFAANRSRAPFQTEYQIMVEEGATPEQVDRVFMVFGYPVGPFMVGDIAGLDIGYAVRKINYARDPAFRRLPIADRLVEMGRHGQKTGAGWYRYEKGSRAPISDPVVAQVIEDVCRERGIERRAIADEEVLMRPLLAAVNEACRILEEGMAVRPGDVDVMWLHGFGFPRDKGGLMFWADTLGLRRVVEQMDRYRAAHGERWRACDLLRDLAERGVPFAAIESRWKAKG
jgi:3-hydroxyacyl-CoA dehydrogenase